MTDAPAQEPAHEIVCPHCKNTFTAELIAGQGTLGALVVDPTVYEQLVQVLGGVGRSRVLRALVRYAISRDDEKGAARVVDDKNVPEVKTPHVDPEKALNSAKR